MCLSKRLFWRNNRELQKSTSISLLAARDAIEVYPASSCLRISTESGGYVFSLNNADWTPVSTHAAKALRPFTGSEPKAEHIASSGMEKVDPATLRKALLAAKEK
jgi:hypothetical protein